MIAELISKALAGPSPEVRAELRAAIRAADNFRPYLDIESGARPLLASGDVDAARAALDSLYPGAFLSPTWHRLLAEVAQRQSDPDAARRSAYFQEVVLYFIFADGDGTAERPWPVQMITDEYDVLRHLRKASIQQRLVGRDDRRFDVHACSDGTELWFELPPVM